MREDSGGPSLMGNCGRSFPEVTLPPASLCIGPCEVPALQGWNQDAQAPNCGHPVASGPSAFISFLHLSYVMIPSFGPGLNQLLSFPLALNPNSQEASSRGSSQHQGKVGAHSQCFLSGLVVGSQEQGSLGAMAATSPGCLVGSLLFIAVFIINMGQVPLQLTALSRPGNLQMWGESVSKDQGSPFLLCGSHLGSVIGSRHLWLLL